MGATGHIGHVVVEDLLKRGHIVRALGRDEKKLHQLKLKGAIPMSLDFDDAASLTEAFQDVYAVFSLIPPTHEDGYLSYQRRVSDAIIKACKDAHVTRIVNLSSLGAHLDQGTGVIQMLAWHEKKLDTLPNLTQCIHLRAGSFMENLDNYLPMIQKEGVIRAPLNETLSMPMCATRDIGWKAADFLDSTAPSGHLVFEFVGPKEVTMQEVAETFGTVLEHPEIHYECISFDQARKNMLNAGMKPDFVDLLLETYQAYNSGLIKPSQALKLTHRGTTTLEEYIQMLTHRLVVLM